jgi:hypothetical protein
VGLWVCAVQYGHALQAAAGTTASYATGCSTLVKDAHGWLPLGCHLSGLPGNTSQSLHALFLGLWVDQRLSRLFTRVDGSSLVRSAAHSGCLQGRETVVVPEAPGWMYCLLYCLVPLEAVQCTACVAPICLVLPGA